MANAQDKTAVLSQMSDNAQDILVQEKTIFPFSIFPDTITVDRVKATISKQIFIRAGEVHSIQIEDVLNVEADMGPIYGSVKLWTRFYNEQALRIDHLSRQGALRVKEILQGYIIARQKQIDCGRIAKRELIPMLRELGKGTTP